MSDWNDALEAAAKVCDGLWINAARGKQQNELSHGCVACREAIRALKRPEAVEWTPPETERINYSCGCSAFGTKPMPTYCPQHESPEQP